jgi:hypothetical protein
MAAKMDFWRLEADRLKSLSLLKAMGCKVLPPSNVGRSNKSARKKISTLGMGKTRKNRDDRFSLS